MECNRDEALRAKEIAEQKFWAKDIKGAKKFALKAQNLYPELEGISQMVLTLEVYLSAEEEKIYGQPNWYSVLGVTRLADDETIKKQYRKLALLLHPDKNRSIGGEGAFKIISQAWSLLSDKHKKKEYDQRYSANFAQRKQTTNEGPSKPPKQNGFSNIAKVSSSQGKVPKGNKSSKKDAPSGPYPSHKKEPQTFWTVCQRCRMQYEYFRMYLSQYLLCPSCNEAFYAVETEPPTTKVSKRSSQTQQWKNASQQGTCGASRNNGSQWAPFSESASSGSTVQAANMVKQAYEKVKWERQKAQAATRREEALLRKNLASKRNIGAEFSGNINAAKRRKVVEDCGTSKETTKQDSLQRCSNMLNGELKQLLMDNAREELRKIVRNAAVQEVHECNKENVTKDINDNSVGSHGATVETKSQFPLNKLNIGTPRPCGGREQVEQLLVNVPSSEFYDFEKDKKEHCFNNNQVWAVYDDDDGMPRNYAMIHDIISLDPFKVRMSWLNSITNCRSGYGRSWFINGFSKTCGEFQIGRTEILNSLDCFSHNVRCVKCTPNTIQIYPRKGEVWALYRNWSPEWNELTEDEVIYKYDMVEIVEDYDDELGIIVIPLVKIAGFKAVFHQHFNPSEIRRIPKEEMSRFSHQVPSHLITGREGLKYPKGCYELDPAAIPFEILEVMSKTEEVEFTEIDKDVEFVKLVDCD
ncbi:hypothetical protein ACJIZ3_010442 [Penstemon smallii]|uniref:J domain-containing protein n=1 Tax=Penstemon smallii TaxID=265156 RepID=A0ABD3TGI1_9LAMI